MEFALNTLDLYLDAAFWLVFGLVVAGLVKAWVPEECMGRWLGGRGLRPTACAALLGAPLPICSCGVLPAAVALRRAGASREATVSFMISTPETGMDSVALSYALLGPFLAVARPIAAVAGAVFTGMLMTVLPAEGATGKGRPADACSSSSASSASSCCSDRGSGSGDAGAGPGRLDFWPRTLSGLRYATTEILDDISPWLGIGLVLAGAVATFVPAQALATWGSGLPAMAIMLVVGIPMYICATAATPLAASLLVAGVSPGAVMVLLLAGPATNVATLAVARNEMGIGVMILYLVGICASSVAAGLVVDALVDSMAVDVAAEISSGAEIVPPWLAVTSAIALALLVARPVYARLISISLAGAWARRG